MIMVRVRESFDESRALENDIQVYKTWPEHSPWGQKKWLLQRLWPLWRGKGLISSSFSSGHNTFIAKKCLLQHIST